MTAKDFTSNEADDKKPPENSQRPIISEFPPHAGTELGPKDAVQKQWSLTSRDTHDREKTPVTQRLCQVVGKGNI